MSNTTVLKVLPLGSLPRQSSMVAEPWSRDAFVGEYWQQQESDNIDTSSLSAQVYPSPQVSRDETTKANTQQVVASTTQWLLSSFLLSTVTVLSLCTYIFWSYKCLTSYWDSSLGSGANATQSFHDRVAMCTWFFAQQQIGYKIFSWVTSAISYFAAYVTSSDNSTSSAAVNGGNNPFNREALLGMNMYDLVVACWNWFRQNVSFTKIVSIMAFSIHESCIVFAKVMSFMICATFVSILARSLYGMPFTFLPGSESVIFGPVVRIFRTYLDPSGQISAIIAQAFA